MRAARPSPVVISNPAGKRHVFYLNAQKRPETEAETFERPWHSQQRKQANLRARHTSDPDGASAR
jgi:hypothetical protein